MSGSLGSGDSVLLGVVRKQRGRVIASVMGAIEDEFVELDAEAQARLRQKVVQAVTGFSDFTIDALKSSRDQSDYTNDAVLRALGSRRG